MIVPFAELLRKKRGAVGAFTCYNFETAVGVLEAARRNQSGVIILISEQSFATVQGPYLVAGLRAMAERAPVPVCLQLDHVNELGQIEAAFELGVGAVMADGSRLGFEENSAFTRQAVQVARRYGGSVEAELGRIEGNEDIATAAQAGALTDPELAVQFVERAQPDCLAVSIGNVHGHYRHPPTLDWPRLEQIAARLSVPLSLHGASGLPDEDLRRAVEFGIAKINVNTELRTAYLETVAEQLPHVRSGARLLALQQAIIEAITRVGEAKIHQYQ